MRKRVLIPPTPATSGHGLCPADEKALRDTLEHLESFNDRIHLMGSGERGQFLLVQAKLKVRLNPPPIDGVVELAQELIKRYGMTLDAGRAATLRRDAELEEINAQRLAAREARAKLIAARAAERERQKLEARLLWQGKT